jgi:hypothetical protein
MHRRLAVALILAPLTLLLASCPRSASSWKPEDAGEKQPPAPQVDWVEKKIDHAGATIALGFQPDEKVLRPVADIQRDGKSLASAMVFAQVVSTDGEKMLSEEVATRYTPLYEAKLPRPSETKNYSVRFRVVLPDDAEGLTRDVPVP